MARKDLLLKEKSEQELIRKRLQDYKKTERQQFRLKKKEDQAREALLKEELKKEFDERKELARQESAKQAEEEKAILAERRQVEEAERKARRELEKQARKTSLRNTARSFNAATARKMFRKIRDDAPRRRKFFLISLNSTVLYLLSYLVLYLVYQAITVIAASLFNYPTIVYYWEVYFNISSEAWYQDSVRTIFSAGPLVLFLLGIIFFIIYSNISDLIGNFKIFFLWGFLNGVNMLFGALLIGTLFETGVGHVISWMYIMDTGRVLYSIISIFILVVAGVISVKGFLISGNTYFNNITDENRGFFIRSQVVVPFILGNAIMILIRQPKFMYYETFTNFVMIISLLPVMVASRSLHDLFFDEDEKKTVIDWKPLLLLAALILLYRGVLQIGIRIGG